MWEGAVTMPQIGNSSTCVCFVIKRMEVEGVQPTEVSIPWLPQEQESNGKPGPSGERPQFWVSRQHWRGLLVDTFGPSSGGGVATAGTADPAPRPCSEAGGGAAEGRGCPEEPGHWLLERGASAGRGGASLRPPGIGWWGGRRHVVRNRRGKQALCGPSLPRRVPGAGAG